MGHFARECPNAKKKGGKGEPVKKTMAIPEWMLKYQGHEGSGVKNKKNLTCKDCGSEYHL